MRVERGVYRAAAAPPHDLAPTMAAMLASGGRASHRTALHLWGLNPLPGCPEVVGDRASKYAGGAKLYRKDLSFFRPVRRVGIPVLDLAGALLTGAEVLDREELTDVVALAVSRRLLNPVHVLHGLVRHAGARCLCRRGRRGERARTARPQGFARSRRA